MNTMTRATALFGLLVAAGCADNPVLAPDVHDEDLEVEVSFSEEHLATLTALEIEVSIKNHDGDPVTDFEMVAVETKLEGEDDWISVETSLHDGHYSADHMFYSSGEYELRVVAQRHGADHAETIFQRGEHLEVERIHMEVGEYRIEMETFPGHIHEGDEAEVKFWVMTGGDGHGPMGAMGGLEADISMTHHGSGATEGHMAEEHTPGVYEAHHTFAEHGETEVMIDFHDNHGEHHEASFHVPVAENH